VLCFWFVVFQNKFCLHCFNHRLLVWGFPIWSGSVTLHFYPRYPFDRQSGIWSGIDGGCETWSGNGLSVLESGIWSGIWNGPGHPCHCLWSGTWSESEISNGSETWSGIVSGILQSVTGVTGAIPPPIWYGVRSIPRRPISPKLFSYLFLKRIPRILRFFLVYERPRMSPLQLVSCNLSNPKLNSKLI